MAQVTMIVPPSYVADIYGVARIDVGIRVTKMYADWAGHQLIKRVSTSKLPVTQDFGTLVSAIRAAQ